MDLEKRKQHKWIWYIPNLCNPIENPQQSVTFLTVQKGHKLYHNYLWLLLNHGFFFPLYFKYYSKTGVENEQVIFLGLSGGTTPPSCNHYPRRQLYPWVGTRRNSVTAPKVNTTLLFLFFFCFLFCCHGTKNSTYSPKRYVCFTKVKGEPITPLERWESLSPFTCPGLTFHLFPAAKCQNREGHRSRMKPSWP